MKTRSTLLILGAFFTCLSCRDGRERARADFERMRRQQRAGSYSMSAAFRDSMAMRVPPRGVLSREEFALGDSVATGRHNGQYVSRIALGLTSDDRRQGEHDFQVYCAVCHGTDGSGGTVVASNLRPPPPSLLADSIRRLTDGELFAIISDGKGRMPPYNWALPPAERWAVIATVRSLQRSR